MKIKAFFLILIEASSMLICGCWDYKEYENLALVSALGFDTDHSARQVTVTLQYLIPGDGSPSQSSGAGTRSTTGTAVVKATGASVDDALVKVQQVTGKKLFYAYMQEIVIGDSAAKQITKDIIGYINRTPNIRNSAYIAITPGKAEDVLNTADPHVTEPASQNIHGLIDEAINSGSAYPVTIERFMENMDTKGKEAVAPRIAVVKTESSDSSSDTSSGNSSNLSGGSFADRGNSIDQGAVVSNRPDNGSFSINGMAVFQSDKLVGWLDGKECTGLGWITSQKYYVYEVVQTSSEQNVMNTMIFRVTNSNCKIKIRFQDGKPAVTVNAYVEADLRKFSNNSNADYLTPDVMERMEKGLAGNVKSEINAAIQKGQKELKSDIFSIGFNLYRQYPQLWHREYEKKWEQIFPTLQINVNVSAKVVDTGTSIKKISRE